MFRENRTAKIVVLSVMGIAGCFGAAVTPENAVPLVHMPRVAQPQDMPRMVPPNELRTAPVEPSPTGGKGRPTNQTELIHPQSFGYFGGQLEGYAYFYEANGVVKAHPRDATLPEVTVTVKDTTRDDLCGPAGLSLYDVASLNGTNLCNGQMYAYSVDDKCVPDPDFSTLTGKAIKVAGAFDVADGQYKTTIDGKAVFSLSCASGAVAKCAHWGYVPGSDPSSRTDHFAACVHAARAEYAAGTSHTCQGTHVDFVDNINVQATSTQPGLTVEAAWGKDGLICLNSARYPACNGVVPRDKVCSSNQMSWGDSNILIWTRSTADNHLHSPYETYCPIKGVNCP